LKSATAAPDQDETGTVGAQEGLASGAANEIRDDGASRCADRAGVKSGDDLDIPRQGRLDARRCRRIGGFGLALPTLQPEKSAKSLLAIDFFASLRGVQYRDETKPPDMIDAEIDEPAGDSLATPRYWVPF